MVSQKITIPEVDRMSMKDKLIQEMIIMEHVRGVLPSMKGLDLQDTKNDRCSDGDQRKGDLENRLWNSELFHKLNLLPINVFLIISLDELG